MKVSTTSTVSFSVKVQTDIDLTLCLAYKRTLRQEIVNMIRNGEVDRNSEFVGTIVDLFRERMGRVCAAGDCVRHQSSFAQGFVRFHSLVNFQ